MGINFLTVILDTVMMLDKRLDARNEVRRVEWHTNGALEIDVPIIVIDGNGAKSANKQ